MTTQVETTVRSPEAYALAHRAVDAMQEASVWPTPLNFEIWLHSLSNPESGLAIELRRILANGPLTEDESERLATEYLPRARLSDEIRDAGAQLSRELSSVAGAIADAQRNQASYGETLAEADEKLTSGGDIQKTIASFTSIEQALDYFEIGYDTKFIDEYRIELVKRFNGYLILEKPTDWFACRRLLKNAYCKIQRAPGV